MEEHGALLLRSMMDHLCLLPVPLLNLLPLLHLCQWSSDSIFLMCFVAPQLVRAPRAAHVRQRA
jgi:hypothetical protein